MKPKQRIRRLYVDLETSPNHVLAWRIGHNIDISHDSIIKERAIICAAWKWEGEPVQVISWDKHQDDKVVLERLIPEIEAADEIVGHYIDGFDAPWVRTRALFHRIKISPHWKTVDTKKLASKVFYFNSNKLDYISKYLGYPGKLETDYKLWKRIVLERDPAALRYMMRYCAKDVVRLEEVYHDMLSYAPANTHAGVLGGGDKWSDPYDGTTNVIVRSRRISATGTIKYQMQNNDTGRYYMISEKAYRDYVKARQEKSRR